MKLRQKHELPVVPTANMVDIAMMLIIFYMACSNFVSQTAAKVNLPKAPDLARQQDSLILVSVDSAGNSYFQGRRVDSPKDIETGLAVLLKDKTTDEARTVMFKCDEAVTREVFEPVMNAIVQGGGIIMALGENIK